MAGKDLEKFIEKYPTYIDALEMLEQKDQRIVELEKELAELKEKAIVPKFKLGQEVWFISDPKFDVYRKVRHIKVEKISISSFLTERGIMYAGGDWAGLSENELFTTLEEAEKKLQELRGGE